MFATNWIDLCVCWLRVIEMNDETRPVEALSDAINDQMIKEEKDSEEFSLVSMLRPKPCEILRFASPDLRNRRGGRADGGVIDVGRWLGERRFKQVPPPSDRGGEVPVAVIEPLYAGIR